LHEDSTFQLDDSDTAFMDAFREENGGSIPAGSVVEGFVALITWIAPDGSHNWKLYNALDRPTSTVIGLLEMAKSDYMEATRHPGDDDE
jgi:hypothetical protein